MQYTQQQRMTQKRKNIQLVSRLTTHAIISNQKEGEGGGERDCSLARPALMPLAFEGNGFLSIVKCIVKIAHFVTAEGAIRMCKMRDGLLPLSRQGCMSVLRMF